MQNRCTWVSDDALMIAYHDQEWGRPCYDDQTLFELLSLETYQAGLSWRTVLHKRAAFRTVFANYDLATVAAFTAADVENLLTNTAIIRHRQKLMATVANARAILAVQKQHGSFHEFLWSFVDGQPQDHQVTDYQALPSANALSTRLSKQLKQLGFKFVGPVTVYSFMQAAGLVNDHEITCDWHNG